MLVLVITWIWSFIEFVIGLVVTIIIKAGEFITAAIKRFYKAIRKAIDACQRNSKALQNLIDSAINRITPYTQKAVSLIPFQNGPLLLQLPSRLVKYFGSALYLFIQGFKNGIPFLAWWLALVLLYWFLNWLVLPASLDPTRLVLISNNLVEGGKSIFNTFAALWNYFMSIIDWVRVPFNILFGGLLTAFQYTSEYFLGEMGFNRLGNLKSTKKLVAGFNSFSNGFNSDNPTFDGTGRRLEQQIFGEQATFGGFKLELNTDTQAARGFAKFYATFFGALAFAIDSLLFIYEIWLIIVAPWYTRLLTFFITLITNFTCVISACSSAKGFGCLIGEFFLVIINAILELIFIKPIKGCPASAYPSTPCYCAKSEGGFITGLGSCPIPVYACVNQNGQFIQVEITTYNGIRTEKQLQSGPTREVGCPRSVRNGRVLQIGSDCRDVCHLDPGGEGWWLNTCDETQTFKGHCAAPYNRTINLQFDPLTGPHRERHLKALFKKPWVGKKERRLLMESLKPEPPTLSEAAMIPYNTFIETVSRSYQNIPNVANPPLDCSRASPYDFSSIHQIAYNLICVGYSAYDLRTKEKGGVLNMDKIFSDSFPERKNPPRRNLADSSITATGQVEYLYYHLKNNFTWEKIKELHIEYVDFVTEGEYESRLKNSPVVPFLNKTAHLLMTLHRRNLQTAEDHLTKRKLESIVQLPGNSRTYICPGTNTRVFQRMSTDPAVPGLESCRTPNEWTISVIFEYIAFLLLTFFYTFNPFTYTQFITDCWASYSNNPESYPLTWEGIYALINNNEEYLSTKTFCFPLIRSTPKLNELIWSFLTYVEENCSAEYSIADGKIDRCLCPMYVFGEVLEDDVSQWIAFIPIFVKYRLINTYRTLQLVWTLFIPLPVSQIWTSLVYLIYPSTPAEVLYIFNKEYAQGAAKYWGNPNDLTPGMVFLCVLLTIQSPFYFVIWVALVLFYLTNYWKFIVFIVEGPAIIIYNILRSIGNFITFKREQQDNPDISSWSVKMRENPLFAMVKFLYLKIIMRCGRDLCPRRVSSYWCPPRPEWELEATMSKRTSTAAESLRQELLSISQPGEQAQGLNLPPPLPLHNNNNNNTSYRGMLNRLRSPLIKKM